MLNEEDKKAISEMIAKQIAVATRFSKRKVGDMPTDDNQLVPKKYVDTLAVVDTQSFSSTGVWYKPSVAGLNSLVFVEMWGGGGSGASRNVGGAGGGGGGYVSGYFQASVLSSSVLVSVGLGGASVASTNNGIAGGNTVFGDVTSILTAYGGGAGSQTAAALEAGAGGGGGSLSAGTNGGENNPGDGGFPIFPFTSEGGMNSAASVAYLGAGGGGVAFDGGQAVYGGGGGGGRNGLGGRSLFGGNGGDGSKTSSIASAGAVPGGGGGGGSILSGAGGDGKAIITVFA